jgi:hypothetical protein
MATTYPGAGDPDGDRRRLALMLARGALDGSPVRHWTQGAARAANAALAGLLMADDGDRSEAASRRTAEALARLLGGGASMPADPAALASEASGQRGYFEGVRAHSASQDARERAGDTRPEPGSTARAAAAAIVADPRADPSAKQVAAGLLRRSLASPQR